MADELAAAPARLNEASMGDPGTATSMNAPLTSLSVASNALGRLRTVPALVATLPRQGSPRSTRRDTARATFAPWRQG